MRTQIPFAVLAVAFACTFRHRAGPCARPLVIPGVMTLRTLAAAQAFSEAQVKAARKPTGFGDILRTLAKLPLVVVALAAVLAPARSYAQKYVSPLGSGTVCTSASPCGFISTAAGDIGPDVGRIVCLNGNAGGDSFVASYGGGVTLEIDCPLGSMQQMNISGVGVTLRIRHLTVNGGSGLTFQAGGTLILEDCIFTESSSAGIAIEPSAPLNVVIKSSRISNNLSGMLLKPAAGGSIKATFDHVTITGNSGGGIKTDSTNGTVNLDVTDSEISNNASNGINLVGSATQNMLNVSRTVIAKNGLAGVQANGANAAALVDTTLFDTNASGATSSIAGGHILTYGNNRIVGSPGSGFTTSALLQ